MLRYNPFRPGSIVGPGMFSGRGSEILALEKVLFQTKNGNPHHFLIEGERGIGKSSLLFYLQLVAKGEIDSIESGTFKFLVTSVEVSPSTNEIQLIQKIGAEVQRVVSSHQRAKELLKGIWDFVTRWEAFGVSYKPHETAVETHELLEDLAHTVDKIISSTKGVYDGIVFLIDEADKPPAAANLGQFVKLFSERLTKKGCQQFSIGLAGLPALVRKLRESHESAPRIFQSFRLDPLLPEERSEVIRKGLSDAAGKNGYEVKATEAAENLVNILSEGYPHFIQQFAYCAFESDNDKVIDEGDVMSGAFKQEGGAFQQLGVKYFEDLYFDQIWSDEYREVLRVIADHHDQEWVNKATIRKEAKIKESTLNNALRALTARNIIVPKRGEKGVYRLPTRSFGVWIRAFTQARKEQEMRAT